MVEACPWKKPAERYTSAAALAADLQRFLEGRPVQARPVGWLEKAVKWVRRNPALTACVASALVALAVTVFFTVRAYQEGMLREKETRENEERLQAEKRQNAIDKALTAATGGDPQAAEQAIAEAERLGRLTGTGADALRGQVGACITAGSK